MTLDVLIDSDPEWDSSIDWAALARGAAEAAIAESAFPQLALGERPVEMSIRLANDEEVHALNAEWRGKDKATNVLSFPMADAEEMDEGSGPELMLGDIILAHGVCASEAAEKSIPLERHATHLLVHGTLHLLGYDHMDDGSAADMESREIRALSRLGISDPYAGETL
ncbi:rRNA maturation RNase YbeY [Sphingomonas sp. HDW15A]|uniref:rRNA maturation RNase YbeY n=1 Tax=Sphingomonas sp. HDW15A TaxID=2714942 RepID=UPI00140CE262|nr:rRNA maturation RNase YbeY [Sphingomonas sp. HDW15A]QIK95430.1 rRNA maturation RNase YbeY [Sphingomonas sp. HDW15A]